MIRRLTHSTVLMSVALLFGWALTGLAKTYGTRSMASVATAYGSLLLIMVTVGVRPWATTRGRKTPTSVDLRRDAGLCASFLAGVHVVAALGDHFGGVVRLYFLIGALPRHDTFGVMAWTGVVATLVVVLLAATSNDLALRRLGKRWKKVQRMVHLLVAATLVHTLLAAHLLRRPVPMLMATALVVGVVYAMRRAAGRVRIATARPASAPPAG